MKRLTSRAWVTILLLAAANAPAAQLNLSFHSDGETAIQVDGGAAVPYTVEAVLTDNANEGLAGILFNVEFSGGDLVDPVSPGPDMASFIIPEGLTNPAGFGGSLVDGVLYQVGGLQNTIANPGPVPPYPTGAVQTGLGHNTIIVATGILTAPAAPGDYMLTATQVAANAIIQGEDGNPFWNVEPLQPGAIAGLTISVGSTIARPLGDDNMGFDPPVVCSDDDDCANSAYCIPATVGQATGLCYVPRNRYLGIDPNVANIGVANARRVRVETGGDPVVLGWVGQPDADQIADIVDNPFYTDWNTEGNGGTVHLTDCHISPQNNYLIQAIAQGGNIADETVYSEPLRLATVANWGDVEGAGATPPQGVVNFGDVLAVVLGFQSQNQLPIEWIDLGEESPNHVVNFNDILLGVNAFQNSQYPYSDPCECANLGPCP